MSHPTARGRVLSHCPPWLFLGFRGSICLATLCFENVLTFNTQQTFLPLHEKADVTGVDSDLAVVYIHFSHSHSQQEDISLSSLGSLNPGPLTSAAVSKLILLYNLFMFAS